MDLHHIYSTKYHFMSIRHCLTNTKYLLKCLTIFCVEDRINNRVL